MGLRIKSVACNRLVGWSAWRLALLLFLFSGSIVSAQKGAIVFWALPQEKVEAMLLKVPSNDDLRFRQLRQYFSELHCTPKLMEEEKVDKQSARNLVCVLPGKDTEEILVAARYEEKDKVDGVPQGWIEAVMLPLLYNALQAEERQHTFVFAALAGSSGEKKFFDNFWRNHRRPPDVIVALDSIALGAPRYFVSSSKWSSNPNGKKYQLGSALGSVADFTIRLQKLPSPTDDPPSNVAVENTLLYRTNTIPAILVYSGLKSYVDNPAPEGGNGDNPALATPHASAPAFHQNFDFVAYYLCKLDVVLPTETKHSDSDMFPLAGVHTRRQ